MFPHQIRSQPDKMAKVQIGEELLLNAVSSAARSIHFNGKLAGATHITIEPRQKPSGACAIRFSNVSTRSVTETDLLKHPVGDSGWGLWGNRLLVRHAGGDVTVESTQSDGVNPHIVSIVMHLPNTVARS